MVYVIQKSPVCLESISIAHTTASITQHSLHSPSLPLSPSLSLSLPSFFIKKDLTLQKPCPTCIRILSVAVSTLLRSSTSASEKLKKLLLLPERKLNRKQLRLLHNTRNKEFFFYFLF